MPTMIAPTGETLEVPAEQVTHYQQRGARIAGAGNPPPVLGANTVRLMAPTGEQMDVPTYHVGHYLQQGAKLASDEKPITQQETPAPILQRIGEGVARGLGMPGPGRDMDAAVAREKELADLTGIRTALKQGDYAGAAKAVAGKLIEHTVGAMPGLGLAKSSIHQLTQARDAISEGDYDRAAIHVGAAALPFASPTADAMEEINKGNVAGGITQAVTNLATLGLGGTRPTAPDLSATVPKRLTEIYQPAAATKFQKDMGTAVPLLKRVEPITGPITRENLPEAIRIAQEANRSQFKGFMDQAEQNMVRVDGKPITDAMRDAIPDKLKLENPVLHKALVRNASVYKRDFRPNELDSFLKTNNAQLDSFYNGLPAKQATTLAANARTSMLEAQTKAFRDSLYNAMDQSGMGDGPQTLQRQYGALTHLREQHSALENKLAKQPEPGRMPGSAPPENGIVSSLFGEVSPGGIAGAVMHPKYALMKTLANQLFKTPTAEDVSGQIANAFRDYKGPWIPPVASPSAPGSVGQSQMGVAP